MANRADEHGLPSTHLLQEDGNKHSDKHEMEIRNHNQPLMVSSTVAWITHSSIIVLSVVVPVIAAIVWLALAGGRHGGFSAFSGERIGGQLSQSQAKAVDVVCSAVLGPFLLAILNFFWFGSARVSAVNERHPKSHSGIPLTSLVAVSTSVGGSYDLYTLAALLRGKTWRLTLLAALTLLSAIAKSAVSNIIAYEAYTKDIEQSNSLRSLSDHTINSTTSVMAGTITLGEARDFTSDFGISQRSDVANQITGLLTGLNFEDAISRLNNGTYIGVNSTTASMDSLPQSVTHLFNVPGFRLTVDCLPEQPDIFSVLTMGSYTTQINIQFSRRDLGMFQAWYPGISQDISGATNDFYQYVAFRYPNNTDVYLGYLTSFNLSNGTMSSAYGDIKPRSVNMTASGFQGTKSVMSYWGIRCWLDREDGLLNYTRQNGQSWSISQSEFFNKTEKVPSSLANWQTNLNYHAPGATIPGIGPALARTAGHTTCGSTTCDSDSGVCMQCDNATDFSVLALNYLYASAESERIVYEVAASNATRDLPKYWYNVSSVATREYYQITYVPAILVAGFVSLIAAAAATATMAAYAYKTYSARTFRQVDVLRLLVDCVDGLQEANAEKDISGLSRSELESWASRCRVMYEKDNEGGQTQVKLCQATAADT